MKSGFSSSTCAGVFALLLGLFVVPAQQAGAAPALPTKVPADQFESEPYRNVGLVRTDSYGQDPAVWGSGWVAGERVVATAAHVFFVEENLGWNRNRWYWLRAAGANEYWNTRQMQQPRSYRVLAGYSDAVANEVSDPDLFFDARNRDALALLFYRSATNTAPPPRSVNALGGSGTYSIVGYPGNLGGVDVIEIEMYAHVGGHTAMFTQSEEVTNWGGWENSLFKTADITSGPGGSGGPVFKLIDNHWTVVGSLLAGEENVSSYSRAVDQEFELLLESAVADSMVVGPGEVLWDIAHDIDIDPVLRSDGSIIVVDGNSVLAHDSTGAQLWRHDLLDIVLLWIAEAPDGRILVGSIWTVVSLDGQTGAEQWRQSVSAVSPPDRGAVGEIGETYVAGDKSVARISPGGTIDWQVSLPSDGLYQPYSTPPAIGPDGTVFSTSQDRIYAINGETGAIIWRTDPIENLNEETLAVGLDGSITATTYLAVLRLDPDGVVRWRHELGNRLESILLRGDGSVIALLSEVETVVTLGPDGAERRRMTVNFGTRSMVEDASGHLYFGTTTGVNAYDANGTKLWENPEAIGRVSMGPLGFLAVTGGSWPYIADATRAVGAYDGVSPDLWQSRGGNPGRTRKVVNTLPKAPRIVEQPKDASVVMGYRFQIGVRAEGTFPMIFEWRRNGLLIPDQIGQRLLIRSATSDDAGDYTVTVRNVAGEVTSQTVAVNVHEVRFGDRLWSSAMISNVPPAIAADGSIYAIVFSDIPGDPYKKQITLTAVDKKGEVEWTREMGQGQAGPWMSPPIIGDDGRIYVTAPPQILAVSSEGVLLWSANLPPGASSGWPTIVLSRENGLFFTGNSATGYIDASGELKWSRTDLRPWGMQVRRDGKMVVSPWEVISPDGILEAHQLNLDNPRFGFIGPNDEWIVTTPHNGGGVTVDRNGAIVARNPDSSYYDTLKFMRADGMVMTEDLRVEPFMGTGSTRLTPPGPGALAGILEGDRLLWLHSDDRISVLSSSGEVLATAEGVTGNHFNIGPDGVLVSGSPLAAYALEWKLANSAWPKERADSRNTNRAPMDFDLIVLPPRSVEIRGNRDPFDALAPSSPSYAASMQSYVGYGASLVANVVGSGPFSFHWFRDGKAVEGVTGGVLRIDSPRISDSGDYQVAVTNSAGTTHSETFTLVVSQPSPVTPGTYVRMWTNPSTSETWPVMFRVTSDRVLEFNLFDTYGVQGSTRILPDGSFYRLGNNAVDFSGSFIGSTLTLTGSAPLSMPPSAASGIAPNGLPAGVYRGHALGPTGYPVSVVVFADGSLSWLQGGLNGYSSSARSTFAGSSTDCTLQVGAYPDPLHYAVKAHESGALVGTLANSATSVTGFVATWTGRAEIERFANLSTRGYVTADQPPMIAGFFFEGPTNHSFLLRAVGPALAQFDIQNPLAKPRLRLMSPQGSELRSCTAWRLDPEWLQVQSAAARLGAFAFAETDIDSAIHSTLSPGGYTMLVDDVSGGAGIALVEVYEDRAASGDASRLRNLSTRGNVGRGERVLVGGFYIGGTVPKSVLIRAAGPTLAHYSQGLFNTASDPRLTIYKADDPHNPIASNDDYWLGGNEPEVRAAAGRVGAFEFLMGSKDAALVLALPPGGYTAVVDNVTPEEGVALLEIYEIPSR